MAAGEDIGASHPLRAKNVGDRAVHGSTVPTILPTRLNRESNMSEHAHPGTGAAGRTRGEESARERTTTPTMWVGWIWFAGIMMIMLGIFNVIDGLVALYKDNFYTVGPRGLLVLNLTGWGWVHLVVGVLAVLAGFALFSGAAWARVVAVILAAFNAVTQLAFLNAYPVWATIVIVLDVVVIWAIVVHGKEASTGSWA
jgi:hypothetical protein